SFTPLSFPARSTEPQWGQTTPSAQSVFSRYLNAAASFWQNFSVKTDISETYHIQWFLGFYLSDRVCQVYIHPVVGESDKLQPRVRAASCFSGSPQKHSRESRRAPSMYKCKSSEDCRPSLSWRCRTRLCRKRASRC